MTLKLSEIANRIEQQTRFVFGWLKAYREAHPRVDMLVEAYSDYGAILIIFVGLRVLELAVLFVDRHLPKPAEDPSVKPYGGVDGLRIMFSTSEWVLALLAAMIGLASILSFAKRLFKKVFG